MDMLPPEIPPRAARTAAVAPSRQGIASSPVFYGANGLRAGWSLLAYVGLMLGFGALASLELRWLGRHLHANMQRPGQHVHPLFAIVAESTMLLAVTLATGAMAWFEHRRAAFYGLDGIDRLRQFLLGLATGFILLSLLVGLLVATHHLQLNRAPLPPGRMLAYAAGWGIFFFIVGLTEEFMLRGYLLFTLARGIRFWPAAIVLAALFGLLHKGNAGESPFGLVAAALIALVFSLSLWRLGHLWWAIGFHTAWDWAESFFYGTADSGMISAGRLMHAHPSGSVLISGGATGPEGSVWVVLVVALAAFFVLMAQPNRGLRLHQPEDPELTPTSPVSTGSARGPRLLD